MSTSPTGFPPKPPGWPTGKTWPPGRQSLDDAFDKLSWAKEHFETLRVEIEPVEQRDTHRISFEVDANVGEYTFYIHDLEEPESDNWGLMIGDCLHNARTALDYLLVRLFALVTGDEPRLVEHIQFPIYDTPKQFNGAVGELRKLTRFSGYLARIEELQPFNLGNASVWGTQPEEPGLRSLYPHPVFHELPKALSTLSGLDNFDKHRVIHAAWLAVNTSTPYVDPPFIPPAFQFKRSATHTGPLKNGAKIGAMGFTTPLPHQWHPDEMDMKRHFPVQVAIYDERGFTKGVLEVLPRCLWAVEAVLALFSPVFAEGKPPLPVAVIPNVGG